jgi:hypothetical protein
VADSRLADILSLQTHNKPQINATEIKKIITEANKPQLSATGLTQPGSMTPPATAAPLQPSKNVSWLTRIKNFIVDVSNIILLTAKANTGFNLFGIIPTIKAHTATTEIAIVQARAKKNVESAAVVLSQLSDPEAIKRLQEKLKQDKVLLQAIAAQQYTTVVQKRADSTAKPATPLSNDVIIDTAPTDNTPRMRLDG